MYITLSQKAREKNKDYYDFFCNFFFHVFHRTIVLYYKIFVKQFLFAIVLDIIKRIQTLLILIQLFKTPVFLYFYIF